MLLVALTALVVLAWYVLVSSEGAEDPAPEGAGGVGLPLSTRIVLAGAAGSGQIVLTCLALGITGLLTPGAVTLTTLLIAAGLVVAALRPGEARGRLAGILSADVRRIPGAARDAAGWETILLTVVLLYAGIWLTTVVAHYPPRGIDDLVYHLPAVYHAVQAHRFEVLPLQLRLFFAFPFNADMPFVWIVLLAGTIGWVDAAQLVFAALGVAAVYALGRGFQIRPRGALFAAGLFGAMPVVLLQATSNYIDVIVNVWILCSAVALLAFSKSGSRAAMVIGGLTAGLVLGSKYQSIPLVATLGGVACAAALGRGLRGGRFLRAMSLFAVPAAPGLYWYVRNGLWYANPFYPLPVSILGIDLFHGDWPQGASTWSALLQDPSRALRIAAWDPGLRTFDGGLGFLFWGLGLSAWAWLFVRRLRTGRSAWRSVETLVLGIVPVGLFTLFLTPFETLAQTPRYVLSIGGLAFIALAVAVEHASASGTGAASVLRAVGVLGALMGLVVGPGSNQPLVDLSPVVAAPGPVRALGDAIYLPMGPMTEGWAPLDAMTVEGGGLTVYQATDFERFYTGPTFGSGLQNRIWNFLPSRDREIAPEAYYYHSVSGSPFYLVKEVHRETVAVDPRYELVASAPDDLTTVYVMKTALAEKGRRRRLADYYRTLRPRLVNDTAAMAEAVPQGEVLLATFPMASAMLVHQFEGRLRAQLVPVTSADLEAESARRADRSIYTIDAAVGGRTVKGRVFRVLGQRHVLYRNDPVARTRPGMPSSSTPPAGSGSPTIPVSPAVPEPPAAGGGGP